jgi:hypothetical protein
LLAFSLWLAVKLLRLYRVPYQSKQLFCLRFLPFLMEQCRLLHDVLLGFLILHVSVVLPLPLEGFLLLYVLDPPLLSWVYQVLLLLGVFGFPHVLLCQLLLYEFWLLSVLASWVLWPWVLWLHHDHLSQFFVRLRLVR